MIYHTTISMANCMFCLCINPVHNTYFFFMIDHITLSTLNAYL